MNIRLILTLSAVGLVMGILSIVGVVHSGVETVLWVVLALVLGVMVARQAPGKFFLHGFLIGFIAGVLAMLVEVAFFDRYLAHNPAAAASFEQLPPSMSPRIVVMLMTPIIGMIDGCVLGLVAWVASKVLRRGAPAPTPPTAPPPNQPIA